MNLQLPERKYPTPEQRAAFYQRLDDRLGAISTIRAGTIATNPPFSGGAGLRLTVEGRPLPAGEQPPRGARGVGGQRYVATLGLRLVRGRAFGDTDGTSGHEVAIVNQRFVSMHFPNEDPVGHRIRLTPDQPTGPEPPFATIVGIAPTVRQAAFQEPD